MCENQAQSNSAVVWQLVQCHHIYFWDQDQGYQILGLAFLVQTEDTTIMIDSYFCYDLRSQPDRQDV